MENQKKKKFQFFQRATHAQVEFIKNNSVRDKRAPFMILKRQDELQKEFQQKNVQTEMDQNFRQFELQFKGEYNQLVAANQIRKENFVHLQNELGNLPQGDHGKEAVNNSVETAELENYQRALEELNSKEKECSDLQDKVVVAEEKTDSLKKVLAEIAEQTDLLRKRVKETSNLTYILEKKSPNFQNTIHDESYKQIMSRKQFTELNAKISLEKVEQQEEIKRRKEVASKIKQQIHWLVSENVKQKKLFEVTKARNQAMLRDLQRIEDDILQKKEAHLEAQMLILYGEIFEKLFNSYVAEDRQHPRKFTFFENTDHVDSLQNSFDYHRRSAFFAETPSPERPKSSDVRRERLSQSSHTPKSSLKKGWTVSSMMQLKTYNKEFIAKRLNQVYERIKMHPEELARKLLVIYEQMQLKDTTLQNRYMELATNVQKKDEELLELTKRLSFLQKGKLCDLVENEEEHHRTPDSDQQQMPPYNESSVALLKQELSTATECNNNSQDKAGNFVFGSYLFLMETLQRFCVVVESIQKVDDFGINIELLRLSKKVKESLQKLRIGLSQKPFLMQETSSIKGHVAFSAMILNSDDDESDRSIASLDSASDYSSNISKLATPTKPFMRGSKKHFTSKFAETVQPFLPQTESELHDHFLAKFPNCHREAELWSNLIRKDRLVYYFTTKARYTLYLDTYASKTKFPEQVRAQQALENIHILKKESLEIQHARFAMLFDYMKDLYGAAENARSFQLGQIKVKNPAFESTFSMLEKEECFSHPDEQKKKTLTDFKRRILAERARKIQIQNGNEVKRNQSKATISLIQLLQDQINEMRSDPTYFNDTSENQILEEKHLDKTRHDIQELIKTQNSGDGNDNTQKIPFYLKNSLSESNKLLNKLVHLDGSFKSHLATAKKQYKIDQIQRKENGNKEKKNVGDITMKESKSQNRFEDQPASRTTFTEFNRTKTKIFGQVPSESFRNRASPRKITMRPHFISQNNDPECISPLTPGFNKESSFSRDYLNLTTETSITKQKGNLKGGDPLNRQSQISILRSNRETPTLLEMRSALDLGQTSQNSLIKIEQASSKSSSQKIANRFLGPILGKQFDTQPQHVKAKDQGSLKQIRQTSPLSESRNLTMMDSKIRLRRKDQEKSRAQFVKNRSKLNDTDNAASYRKDSNENSLKSFFSNLETHLPSLGNISENIGNRTSFNVSRRSPILETEGKNSPVSMLQQSFQRRGFLIQPFEGPTFNLQE